MIQQLGRHLRAAARCWPAAAAVAVVAIVLGAALSLRGSTTYAAQARIFLRDNPFHLSVNDLSGQLAAAWARATGHSTLLSDAVIARAIREGLQDHFHSATPEDLAASVLAVRDRLSAGADEGPNLLVLTCTDDRPGRAVAVANAVARAFDKEAAEQLDQEIGRIEALLQQAAQDRDRERRRLAAETETIRPTPAETEFERTEKALMREVENLESALSAERLEAASLATETDLLMERIERADFGPAGPADTSESERISRELESARRELDELRASRPEDAAGIAAASERVDRLRRLRAEALDKEILRSRFAPMRSLLDQLREKTARRERLVASARDTQVKLDKARRRLQEHRDSRTADIQSESRERAERRRRLEVALAGAEGSLNALRGRLSQVAAAKAVLAPPTGRLEPAGAAAPLRKTTLWPLFLCSAAGITLGFAVAAALGRGAWAVRTEADVRRCANLPILGTVPAAGAQEPVIVRADPAAGLSETWQSIGVVVESAARRAGAKALLVTSPCAGEGKSTVACNLAVALARSGASTLLADCDLRRPTQHQIFALPAEWSNAGLSAFIQNVIETVNPAIAATEIENLGLLPAGPFPGPTTTFFRSERFAAMLEGLREKHEYVVLDGPPVTGTADGLLLASRADAVVLVLAAGETQKDDVARAKRLLAAAGGGIIGCVLNKVALASREYYSYSPCLYAEVEE